MSRTQLTIRRTIVRRLDAIITAACGLVVLFVLAWFVLAIHAYMTSDMLHGLN